MKQLTALIWKEWHEVRILFAIALFVFLGLPIIGGLQYVWFNNGRFSIDASVWVAFLGGLLAIVVGVGIVTRDVNGKLEEFWRSRPVSIWRWLLIKYAVGLAIVLSSLILPMCVERAIRETVNVVDSSEILAWHPFLWIALFSIAFATACIVRRGAHAGMLSVAIALLIYFLPSIVPPLRFLGVMIVADDSRIGVRGWYGGDGFHSGQIGYVPWVSGYVHYGLLQLAFVAGMLGIAILAAAIAFAALHRDWRIEAGRKMLYWSVGTALLILFATAAFQVSSNLPVQHKMELDARNEVILTVGFDGERAIVTSGSLAGNIVRTLDVSEAGAKVTSTVRFSHPFPPGGLWDPKTPTVLYAPFVEATPEDLEPNAGGWLGIPKLTTIDLRNGGSTSVMEFPELAAKGAGLFGARIFGDRLYLLGPGILIFDISDRYHPKLLTTIPMSPSLDAYYRSVWPTDAETVSFPLPSIPDLTARQKLEFVDSSVGSLRENTLIQMRGREGFSVYDLKELTETSATFQRRSSYKPTFMQGLFGGDIFRMAGRSGDLLYGFGSSDVGGLYLSVFDTRLPVPAPVGHFAFGRWAWEELPRICPLPDGRVLMVSKDSVSVLGAPKLK